MVKTINNQCDKQGNAYITLGDILGKVIHYDDNGKFKYIQDTSRNKYTELQNIKMDSSLKLIDPTAPIGENNILAENTAKSVEIKVDPEVSSCIRLNQNDISIDTMRHGCSIQQLLGTDDTIKINLKDGAELNQEFAKLGGTVNLTNKGNWINLGLNESELSNIRVKITHDCIEYMKKIREKEVQEKLVEEIKERDACEPDIAAIRDHRYDIEVKSSQFDGKVGSVNLASWFFRKGDLYYDLRGDDLRSARVGEDNVYLKVLPCDEAKKYYKLALCDKDGNVAEKTQKGIQLNSKGQESKTDKETTIYISECNLIDGQKIQLEDYYREDEKPSFIIKPSESKDWGESSSDGIRSRAEVYQYNPVFHDIGDKVGKLNATDIRVSGNSFIIDNLVLEDRYTTFRTNRDITVRELEDHSYYVDKPFSSDEKTTKLILDDLLCLFDQNLLQDGIQIIG